MKLRRIVAAVMLLGLLSIIIGSHDVQAETPQISPGEPTPLTLPNCFAMIIEEADIPAKEAGVLSELKVHEGAKVRAGDLLARLEDSRAEIDKKLADFEFASAREKSENDINVRYAKAAADVAEAEFLASQEANKRVDNSVSRAEIRKLQLEHRRAVLQIEQSNLEQSMARHAAQAEGAKVEAAADNIRRRRITSPLDGTVVEVRRHLGEWVQPGETVMHVVRLDHLRVEGFAKADGNPSTRIHQDQPVTVELEVGGERRQLRGRVVFVSPLLQTGGNYRVWAEIENQAIEDRWLLQPGQPVAMTIR
ncbi:MAG: HlyD family efflux transporter periplasmic adaptor subunit [Planctomycetia bacterium]|nr:HlyD family efflux transporter periplasmic adaptor subunit [Planctomycetia bacterium]